jgi:hypothetical protein
MSRLRLCPSAGLLRKVCAAIITAHTTIVAADAMGSAPGELSASKPEIL